MPSIIHPFALAASLRAIQAEALASELAELKKSIKHMIWVFLFANA